MNIDEKSLDLLNSSKYGALIHEPDIKLHRKYFTEMCKLLGIKVLYYAPRNSKGWTTYGEIETNFYEPKLITCIFNDHPNQWTMKKLGWDAEFQESASLISVDYDLENIQVGALFAVPTGVDKGKARLFRVTKMSNIMIYPASITCELVPEYENTYQPSQKDYTHSSMNLLNDEEEDYK
jgi:hypothetical protein